MAISCRPTNDDVWVGAWRVIESFFNHSPIRGAGHAHKSLHWHNCSADEPGYSADNLPKDYSKERGGCSFPWMITDHMEMGL